MVISLNLNRVSIPFPGLNPHVASWPVLGLNLNRVLKIKNQWVKDAITNYRVSAGCPSIGWFGGVISFLRREMLHSRLLSVFHQPLSSVALTKFNEGEKLIIWVRRLEILTESAFQFPPKFSPPKFSPLSPSPFSGDLRGSGCPHFPGVPPSFSGEL